MKFGLFSRKRTEQGRPPSTDKRKPGPDEATQPTREERSIEANSTSEGLPRDAAQGDTAHQPRDRRVAELREKVRGGTYEIPLAPLIRILAAHIFKRR